MKLGTNVNAARDHSNVVFITTRIFYGKEYQHGSNVDWLVKVLRFCLVVDPGGT
jgi:hypothetical protein